MNDEVLNEIEKVAPIITDEAKKLFAEQDAELGIEQPTVDQGQAQQATTCLLYTSPSPRDATLSRMPSSA